MSQNVDASIGQDYTRLALNFLFIKDDIFKNKENIVPQESQTKQLVEYKEQKWYERLYKKLCTQIFFKIWHRTN